MGTSPSTRSRVLSPVAVNDFEQIAERLSGDIAFGDASAVITGAGGFVGYYLTTFMALYGRELGIKHVTAIDNFSIPGSQWLAKFAEEESRSLSIRNLDIADTSTSDAILPEGPTLVVHAASIASPAIYRQFPLRTIDANVWGLRRILDEAVNHKEVHGILFFSSSEIYGDPPPGEIPTNENYRGNVACIGPRAPYDEAKRFGETLAAVFSSEHGLPISIVRPFNNFGPGMRRSDRRLPADLAIAVSEGSPIVLHSDGRPTRTYCYIADAVEGYLRALHHDKFGVFNIGSDEGETSVLEAARCFRDVGAEVFGHEVEISFQASSDHEYLVDNPQRRSPDIARARSVLGFNPTTDFTSGVRKYLEHIRWMGQQ